jgi:glycosyltransferase involved in cell wall biosynthesis
MTHALAILTYVPTGCDPAVRGRLPLCLDSLKLSGYDGPVYIVDDGSTDADHASFLAALHRDTQRYKVLVRPERGGCSKAKNTCLRALYEHDVDVGFVAEDDTEFHADWWMRYLEVHEQTGIDHLSWAWDNDPSGKMKKWRKVVNGCPLVKTSRVNGLLLSFTQEVVDKVGGFRVLPAPWGHEHTNWSNRIIAAGLAPYFADVDRSSELITISPAGEHSALSDEDKVKFARQNRPYFDDVSTIYYPLDE